MMSLKVVTTFIGQVEYPIQYLMLPYRDSSLDHIPEVLRPWNHMESRSYFSARMYELGFYWARCDT